MMKALSGLILLAAIVGVAACSSAPGVLSDRGVTIAARGESLDRFDTGISQDEEGIETEPTETVIVPSPAATATETTAPSPSPVEPTATVTATVAPSQTEEGAEICQPSENAGFERSLLTLINQARSAAGIPALVEQAQLTGVARSHSAAMGCDQFFDHVDPEAGDVEARVTAAGYSFTAIGENIAAGYESAQAVFDAWAQSPAHEENMLNPAFSQVGIGYVLIEGSQYGSYWTLILAAPE
jgi:uncharacterized protein YkwD